MTKRLTIALVAVALFVLMAVMPVSAYQPYYTNGSIINQGATVFIGETGLNIRHALNGAAWGTFCGYELPCEYYNYEPDYCKIGWWASAADIFNTAPSQTVDLCSRYDDFFVAPADFVGYTGNWYLLNNNGRAYTLPEEVQTATETCACTYDTCIPALVFVVADPSLDIRIWDFTASPSQDVTGKSVPQGERLSFRIDTNMYAAVSDLFSWEPYTPPPKRGNLIDLCPVDDTCEYDVEYVAYGDCCVCHQTSPVCVETCYTDGINWATWMDKTDYLDDQLCYATVSNKSYSVYDGPTTVDPRYCDNNQEWYMNVTGSVWDKDCHQIVKVDEPQFNEFVPGFSWDPYPSWGWHDNPECGSEYWDPFLDGFIDIKLKDESGAQLSKLYNTDAGVDTYGPHSILKNFVWTSPWFWGNDSWFAYYHGDGYYTDDPYYINWDTEALNDFQQYIYPVGTYTVSAESKLNSMKDMYKQGGADYTGKTVSQAYTITLVSDTVKIEPNKDSVVRSKTFSVTVTGRPLTYYYVWVKGTSTMSGTYDDQPPLLVPNQVDVKTDPVAGPYKIGGYQYENGAGNTIYDDVAVNTWTGMGTREYALIKTNPSGVRTIEFTTTNWTKAQKYTIRVEQQFPYKDLTKGQVQDFANGIFKNDECDVKVEKGAVTIVAAGDQSYYLGEEIKFSGTNTETYKTYLFIVGPNLPDNGADIKRDDPRHYPVANGNPATFKVVDVNGDNTWSWKWGTANYALDAGTYTIYAVSQPSDKDHLENAAYGTVSIIIKKPFVSATASQSTVAKGDRIYITGTAEGQPNAVQIWILGKNFYTKDMESVNSDASFKYEVTQDVTKKLASGQYFVVVQHPMQNTLFDVDTVPRGAINQDNVNNDLWVYNLQLKDSNCAAGANCYTKIFKLGGAGSLQGSDAAEALVEGINDANVDDTYTKLQFLVEEPVIRIDPIGDKHVGDKFTITAQTNLAVDDEVLVQVYSSSFKPTDKSQSGEFSGATGTVKVTKGDSGMNKISFDVDSSTFKPDEYIVTAQAVIQDNAVGTALFNVLETPVVTATPVVVVTSAAPTEVPTTVVTTAPTAVPTTKSPGYGALIALIGLGAVAFIVVRRH